MTTTFFRLLKDSDKAAALERVVADYRAGTPDGERTFTVDPEAFRKVPNTPFAYWVDDSIRELFVKLPPFESEGRTVKQGLATADDFRFVRAWWEVDAERRLDPGIGGAPDWRENLEAFQQWCRTRTHQGKFWVPFAKGGEYSPYYSDIHLVVNWKNEGEEIKQYVVERYPYLKGNPTYVVKHTDYYFRPGVTWPRRTNSRFGPYLLPSGCIFADKGPTAFPKSTDVAFTLAVLFSDLYRRFIDMYMAGGDETQSGTPSRSYEGGIIGAMPYIAGSPDARSAIEQSVLDIVGYKLRFLAEWDDASAIRAIGRGAVGSPEKALTHWVQRFVAPIPEVLGNFGEINTLLAWSVNGRAPTSADGATLLGQFSHDVPDEGALDAILARKTSELIAESISQLGGDREYSVKSYYVDRKVEIAAQLTRLSPMALVRRLIENPQLMSDDLESLTTTAIQTIIGLSFARWDMRIITSDSHDSSILGPLDPLPVAPPASLVSPNGLPATSGNIVSEEWLQARADANSLPPAGSVGRDTIDDSEYPIPVPWDGILVDDPDSSADIVERVRLVLRVLHGDRAEGVERELVAELGVGELRDYLSSPSGFFDAHLKTYSKSRRKAPIYWPLSTASGGYTVWVYYPRLSDATLFTVLDKYLQPKIAVVERELAELSGIGSRSRSQQKRFDLLTRDIGELHQFAAEIKRITNLPYNPDHDDGVPICAAPLWQLFRHSAWSSYCRDIWENLEAGSFDWAHLAFAVWPDRVRAKAAGDRSIAIAHGI